VSVFEPTPTPFAEPFWEATRRRELVLPWCGGCDAFFWFPRELCPRCHSTDVSWRPAPGGSSGTVHAVSVHHRPGPGRDPADGPYAVAFIDLDAGVRLLSNVVGVDPESVQVGQAVSLTWLALSDGRHLPQFEPA
jgi:uncharacterized OB-fold protein